MKKVYGSSEHSTAPLSVAWEANGLVFLSGQIHADKDWNLLGGTVEERFKVAVGNIEKILADMGLGLSDVVHIRLFLTDLGELPKHLTKLTRLTLSILCPRGLP